jgi:hypothetical protein
MGGRRTRNFVRAFVGTALCAALIACAAAPVPEDLPAVAFRQAGLYRLEIALIVFYGSLLLITPAFSGLIRGRLPIEISTRGARFAEEEERSIELDEAVVRKLEGTVADLAQALADTRFETEQLNKIVESDSKQQGVDSNR